MTACLLVLGSWTGTPSILSLPLQSRVSLRTAVRDLRNLGYQVEFAYAGTHRDHESDDGATGHHGD